MSFLNLLLANFKIQTKRLFFCCAADSLFNRSLTSPASTWPSIVPTSGNWNKIRKPDKVIESGFSESVQLANVNAGIPENWHRVKTGKKLKLSFNQLSKEKIDCLRFMCPLLAAAYLAFFLAVAINSTNETNKAGSMRHYAVYITQMSLVLI